MLSDATRFDDVTKYEFDAKSAVVFRSIKQMFGGSVFVVISMYISLGICKIAFFTYCVVNDVVFVCNSH